MMTPALPLVFVRVLLLSLMLIIASCGMFGGRYNVDTEDGRVKTLGSFVDQQKTVEAVIESSSPKALPEKAQAEEIAEAYRHAFELIDDPVTKNHILQRLAAIDLKTAENMDVAGLLGSQQAYQIAIDAYTALLNDGIPDLQESEQAAKKDQLLYALSKAYALKGESKLAYDQLSLLVKEFPQSTYWLEAQFRRGEYLFAQNEFRGSAKVYAKLLSRESLESETTVDQNHHVSDRIPSDEIFSNARYMAGWSEFKNSRYDNAVDYFVALIDEKLSSKVADLIDQDSAIFEVDYVLGEVAFVQDEKILDDALRAISLSFAYLPMQEVSEHLNRKLADKEYAYWVYAELAELFFKQERFADAAVIYGAYGQSNPQSIFSPWFHRQQIAVMQHANFNEQAWEQKANFADLYHPLAGFYQDNFFQAVDDESQPSIVIQGAVNDRAKQYIDSYMATYLDELASFHHAKGRALVSKTKGLADEALVALDKASYWYQKKITAYPDDPAIAETYYLLAESLNESNRLPEAIAAYEYAAYATAQLDAQFEKANDAGYAALVSYDDYLEDLKTKPELTKQWRTKKIESALMFTEGFPDDKRRDGVIADTVADLQNLGDWEQLITVADKLLFARIENTEQASQLVTETRVETNSLANSEPVLNGEPQLLVPTWLASAQAAYYLARYSEAEKRYEYAISTMQIKESHSADQRRFLTKIQAKELEATKANYASSIYRQGEIANEAGESLVAIDHFQRLVLMAPESELRVSAQRDSIVLLAKEERWQDLKIAVPRFLTDFPNHSDKLDMQRRLLSAQVATVDWVAASSLAVDIALALESSLDTSANKEVKQEISDLRYAAADYAEKSGDKALAIKRYKQIVSNSRNFGEQLYEAHYRLANLYIETNNRDAQFQQYRVIKNLEAANAKRSSRSLFIVADAESQLAELDYRRYQKIKITAPLQKSLAKKQAALETAIEAYTRTENYAVEKFALLATQRKAQIYADFAKSIMASERPKGLDELALEEYDILLEDQAYPFEEKAVALYEVNVQRAWEGMRSQSIKDSYRALADLLPARYNKPEILE